VIYADTETCGLYGPIVLMQWAIDDGPVHMLNPWTTTIDTTIDCIQTIVDSDSVWFNVAFDWFHLCQMYTTLTLLRGLQGNSIPIIDDYAIMEGQAREVDICLKPKGVFDIMLHARKGPYQALMDRKPIRIKRVPRVLAQPLADKLTELIKLKDVLFAKKADSSKRWSVLEATNTLGEVDDDFRDLELSFAPSGGLKALAVDALGATVQHYVDIAIDSQFLPKEVGYAPFALAPYKKNKRWVQPRVGDWKGKWPDVITQHISHWENNQQAREYAEHDVTYVRSLYNYFKRPAINDKDSILAAMVGAVRWRGFTLDIPKLKALLTANRTARGKLVPLNSPQVCRVYLEQVMSDTEKIVLIDNDKVTTKRTILEEVAQWTVDEVCDDCYGAGCDKCVDGLIKGTEKHKAAVRAQNIVDYRRLCHAINMFEKLLTAGKFHASFEVIGTLSSRMSGGDGLNAQGINHAKDVRECFTLANKGHVLEGGDFDSFEISIADAVYDDDWLHEQLLSGKKLHGLMGENFFPGKSYDEILSTDGSVNQVDDLYKRSKQGVFALLYGGTPYTLHIRVGIATDVAEEAERSWLKRCKGWGEARARIFDKFCTMRQPGGLGTRVEWHEPVQYIESILGFRRYFTLETQICHALYKLGEEPPEEWVRFPVKVTRRDREQTAGGALRSALFGAAFKIQARIMRAAANHEIQSPGGELTKEVQSDLWTLQPAGINSWHVQPLNVHDEVKSPCIPSLCGKQKEIVEAFIERRKATVPLLAMDWLTGLNNWGDK